MESPSRNVVQEENGDPSMDSFNETGIQITVVSGSTPTPIRNPLSVEATSDFAMMSALIGELYAYAVQNKWHQAKPIFDKFNDMVHVPLTANGDTALHVAVTANSSTFVIELVNFMTPNDLETQNIDGNTAFCVAAITGKGDFFQIMIEKNEKLPEIPGQGGLLPVHLAVLNGNHKIVKDLSSPNLLENLKNLDFNHIEKLFFMTINSGMHDVSMTLVDKYSKPLIVARYGNDEKKMTALHLLMQMQKSSEQSSSDFGLFSPSFSLPMHLRHLFFEAMLGTNYKETSSRSDQQLELFKKLWLHATCELERKDIVKLITHPSVVLFDAVKFGNVKEVKWLLYINRDLLLTMKDPESGRNIMHIAVLYKQHNIFYFILKMETEEVNSILRAVDKEGNNILHLAATHDQQQEPSSSTSLSIDQMQKDWSWFKEVANRVPSELRKMKNKDGKRPIDIIDASQEKVSQNVLDVTTKNAKTGIVVAALVASIAFDSALTVPGGKYDSRYANFVTLNAFALMFSATSIMVFLTFFLRLSFTKSARSAEVMLVNGQIFLFFSIISMIAAFVVASFSLFDLTDKKFERSPYAVLVLGLLPIYLSTSIMSMVYAKALHGITNIFGK